MNLTAVGSGADSDSSKSKGMDIRDNPGGYVLNSIFTEFPNGILKVEKTSSSTGTQGTTNTSSYGSQALLEDNLLGFFGNIFCYGDEADSSGNYANTQDGVVYDSTNSGDNTAAEVKAVVFASTNSNTADISPLLNNTDLEHGSIMPFPIAGSSALSGAVDITSYNTSGFFTDVDYQGAFKSDALADNWLAGWTAVSNPFNVSITGSSVSVAKLIGISTRGPISKTVAMTRAVAVTGSGTKKVAFMAKGTTMFATDSTINVVKDPKMIIYKNDGSGLSE